MAAAVAVFAKVVGLVSDKYQLGIAAYLALSTADTSKQGLFAGNNGPALLAAIDKGGAALGMLMMGFGKDTFGNVKGFIFSAVLSIVGYALAILTNWGGFYVFLTGKTLIGIGMGFEYVLAPSSLSEGAKKHASSRNIGYLYAVSSVVGATLVDLTIFIGLSIDPDETDPETKAPTEKRQGIIMFLYIFGLVMVIAGLAARCTLTSHGPQSKDIMPPAAFYTTLLGTSAAWFMYDYVEYGLNANKSNLLSFDSHYYRFQHAIPNLIVSAIYIFPLIGVSLLTGKVSNKKLQLIGFIGCGSFCAILGVVNATSDSSDKVAVGGFLGLILFVMQKSFQAFLGITTMALATECFPLDFRGKALGVSAAIGKVGAFVGTECITHWTSTGSSALAFFSCTLVCAVGVLSTIALTPDYTPDMRMAMQLKADAGDFQGAIDALYGKSKAALLDQNKVDE